MVRVKMLAAAALVERKQVMWKAKYASYIHFLNGGDQNKTSDLGNSSYQWMRKRDWSP
jgi:hypothetical protein